MPRSYDPSGSGHFVGSDTPSKSSTTSTKSTSSSGGGSSSSSSGGGSSSHAGGGFMDGSGFDAQGNYVPATKKSPLVPATSPVVTSDPARDGYSAIRDAIGRISKTTPAISIDYNGKRYQDTTGLLGAQRDSLAQRRSADIGRINTEYAQNQQAQKQSQRSEVGASSMGLARIGGFDSASGQAALTNLQRVHISEQNALISQRDNAIQTAQNAFEDKDFALAQLQLTEARKSEQMIYDRNKDFINLTLQLRGEQRADAASELQKSQFDYQKQRDNKADAQTALTFSLQYGIDKPFFVVGGIGYDTSTGDKLSYEEFIARGGKPDFSNATIIKPGTIEDKAFVQELRKTYPDAGITSADTAEQAQNKIKNSRIYRKETYIAPSGGGGGISAAKTAAQSNVITRAREALQGEASGSRDGKANPTTYRNFISEYVQAGGSANDFYTAVSLDQFIDEKNRKGDLAGTSIQYQQQKAGDPAADQARMNELIGKLDADTISTQELIELQQLRSK